MSIGVAQRAAGAPKRSKMMLNREFIEQTNSYNPSVRIRRVEVVVFQVKSGDKTLFGYIIFSREPERETLQQCGKDRQQKPYFRDV